MPGLYIYSFIHLYTREIYKNETNVNSSCANYSHSICLISFATLVVKVRRETRTDEHETEIECVLTAEK